MAETSKILSPEKTVLIPDSRAGCSLAASITGADVRALRAAYPGVPVVAYVNTSAEVKAEVDICCTSSNALRVVESLGVDRVIFVDIIEFRLNPPGNRWIWDGMASANIGIIERDSLDPDAFAEEYSVSVKFPDVKDLSRESAAEEQVQLGLIAKFTQTVNKLFYDHIEDKYPNKRLRG
jgi:hypothetical protein